MSLEGCIHFHVIANATLTDVRYREVILRASVGPYAVAVGPGFLLVRDNARPHVARVCGQFLDDEGFDAINIPSRSPDLNPIEHLLDIMYRVFDVAQYLHRLSRSSLIPWSRSGRRSPRTRCWGRQGPYTLLSHILSCCDEINASWICLWF